LDLGEVGTLVLQPLQDEVNSLEPQSNGRKHFALIRVGEDAFLDAILGEVGVEVDFCFMNKFEVRTDDDSYKPGASVHVEM
jgi:hypothetical protein